ncbi:MAG: hypothetical protein ACTSYC_12440 [Promethearchaeota archaeon]
MKRTKLFALFGVLSAFAFLLGLTSIGIAGCGLPVELVNHKWSNCIL